jgi:hypothetical protein
MGWLTFRNICGIKDHGYGPLVISTSRTFSHSLFITGFVPRVTQQVPLVVLELHTLPKHLSSPPGFRRVRVAQSLVFCVMFCPSFFNLRILITFWYLQTLLDFAFKPTVYWYVFIYMLLHTTSTMLFELQQQKAYISR